ncbi:MAG: hypothetical protein ACOCRX_05245 [Candidatus Woesearchaeota archaeon]
MKNIGNKDIVIFPEVKCIIKNKEIIKYLALKQLTQVVFYVNLCYHFKRKEVFE